MRLYEGYNLSSEEIKRSGKSNSRKSLNQAPTMPFSAIFAMAVYIKGKHCKPGNLFLIALSIFLNTPCEVHGHNFVTCHQERLQGKLNTVLVDENFCYGPLSPPLGVLQSNNRIAYKLYNARYIRFFCTGGKRIFSFQSSQRHELLSL